MGPEGLYDPKIRSDVLCAFSISGSRGLSHHELGGQLIKAGLIDRRALVHCGYMNDRSTSQGIKTGQQFPRTQSHEFHFCHGENRADRKRGEILFIQPDSSDLT